MTGTKKGMLVAGAALSLVLAGAVKARSAEKAGGDQVQCGGINECKGHGACAGDAGNTCKGKNACKGKGWVATSAEDCKAKGGKNLGKAE